MKKKEIYVWKTHQVFESVQISQVSTETKRQIRNKPAALGIINHLHLPTQNRWLYLNSCRKLIPTDE